MRCGQIFTSGPTKCLLEFCFIGKFEPNVCVCLNKLVLGYLSICANIHCRLEKATTIYHHLHHFSFRGANGTVPIQIHQVEHTELSDKLAGESPQNHDLKIHSKYLFLVHLQLFDQSKVLAYILVHGKFFSMIILLC